MVEINNTTKHKINAPKIKIITDEFLRVYKKTNWEVSVAIVGPARMRRLNNDYRGIDKTTDVLSFGSDTDTVKKSGIAKQIKYLGEVVININETKKPAKYLEVFSEKKSADYIFYFLLVHGLLHLIGYNDEKEEERKKMLILGAKFLERCYNNKVINIK
ncbi:MAG: rRNA maturation RNase YbeY [Patescibacteria group bacterium]